MRNFRSLALMLVFTFVQLPFVSLLSTDLTPTKSPQAEPWSFNESYPEYNLDDLQTTPIVTNLHYDFLQPSSGWHKLTSGDSPATFSQVQYELAADVLDITGSNTVVQQIASEGQLLAGSSLQKQKPIDIVTSGGFVPMAVLDAAAAQQGRAVENGMVVVDKASRTAFKVVSPTVHTGIYETNSELSNMVSALKNTYSIARPQLHEIFKDFSLGGADGETIELTRGNISGFAPNIEKSMVFSDPSSVRQMSLKEMYQGYLYIYGDKLVDLKFDETLLDAQTSSGAKIQVKVSGGIGIQKLLVNAKYTKFSGYRFAVTLNQESYLTVELAAAISEEIRIPVFGIDAGIGDVGRVTGGVFVIVGLDGNLRLEIAAREFTSTTVGVRGKTAAYIPCSIRPVYNQTIKGEGDVRLTGDVDGYIKFGPMLGIELFGYDLVGAGVFLGTGVQVEADLYELDIELYGILNVYIDFLGKHFNLINLRPTLWEKKQTNTAGHRVTFMEAYVYPGRVSGVIEKEVPSGPGNEDGFTPVANLPYRIWIVPKDQSFNPNNPSDLNNSKIRKFPSSGYAKTNADGVFFQKNESILEGGERAFVEFQINGKSYFSNGADATLPFEKFTITQVDYFNDFVVGQVQPIRLINYDAPANDAAKRYELYYYQNSSLQVWQYFVYKDPYKTFVIDTGGVAFTRTDEFGNFDTRNVLINDDGEEVPHFKFDARPDADKWIHFDSFSIKLVLDHEGATISSEVPFTATMDMNFTRTVTEVPDSYKRFEIGGKIVDQMAYDEHIYIINLHGTLAVSEDEFCYVALPFSTQDFHAGLIDYRYVPAGEREMIWQSGAPDVNNKPKKLLQVLDANGNPTGAALFSQRVYVEWVWQAHPNPVKITSVDHAGIDSSGGSFQVTATGYAPFAFSLTGAPAGVTIDRNTGLLSVAEGTPVATYTFTIRAEENREAYQTTLPNGQVLDQSKLLGPYEGNDPSPPGEQLFTLIVSEAIAPPPEPSPEPTAAPTAEPTPTTAPPPRIAPMIQEENHNYAFAINKKKQDVNIPIYASGSLPITWSLEQTFERVPVPEALSIDPQTGVLTIRPEISVGNYYFTVRAANDVGFDTQECTLKVNYALPVLQDSMPSSHLDSYDYRHVSSLSSFSRDFFADSPSISQDFFSSDDQFAFDPSDLELTPPNTLTLRYDDPNDIYTTDRWTKNGAAFVRWHACPGVLQRFNHYNDVFWSGGTGTVFLDSSPRSDNYHHHKQESGPVTVDDIMKYYQDRMIGYYQEEENPGQFFDRSYLTGYFDPVASQKRTNATYLDYGTTVDKLNSSKGGNFEITLDQYTGGLVTGKFFTALQNNEKATLSFLQEGAAITFNGRDISHATNNSYFDLSWFIGSIHDQDMRSGLDPDEQHFTFGFAENGDLPGLATFTINTGLAKGTPVNVYQFNVDTGQFSLIAGNLSVGRDGAVTYRNHELSSTLITTQTLRGAAVSDVAGLQNLPQDHRFAWFIFVGIAVLLVAGAGVGVWCMRRKKMRV